MNLSPADVTSLENVLALAERVEAAREIAALIQSRPQIRKQVIEAEQTVERYSQLYNAYDRASSTAIKAVQGAFMERASPFVGEGERVVLDVTGPRVVFGLEVDGELIPGASGSEGNRLMTATIGALPPSEAGRALVVTLPDRMWDPDHLHEFMEATKDLPHQLLIQSTVKYKGRKPSGWSVLELDSTMEVAKAARKAAKAEAAPAPKQDAPPDLPSKAPDWLRAAYQRGQVTPITGVADWVKDARPDAAPLTITEVSMSERQLTELGTYHKFDRLRVVTFTPHTARNQSWCWAW